MRHLHKTASREIRKSKLIQISFPRFSILPKSSIRQITTCQLGQIWICLGLKHPDRHSTKRRNDCFPEYRSPPLRLRAFCSNLNSGRLGDRTKPITTLQAAEIARNRPFGANPWSAGALNSQPGCPAKPIEPLRRLNQLSNPPTPPQSEARRPSAKRKGG